MEDVLSQLDAGSLTIKLTSDKLYINTPTSNEAFALRSIDGVGVIDLIENYNEALTQHKQNQSNVVKIFGVGLLVVAGGIYSFIESINSDSSIIGSLILLFIGIGISLVTFFAIRKAKEPQMLSAVRIMMRSGNRDFQFDKTGSNSEEIAEFVAKIESTLTSYHKNHD
jgi:hypothetical protein